MISNLEILNFSFRNGVFCINLKDKIGNYHSVPFETGYLKNAVNNYHLKTLYGFTEDYIGKIHVIVTNFFGLYQILENRKIEFIKPDNPEKNIKIDISFSEDKPDMIIMQYTDILYVIIYYPEDKIYNIEGNEDKIVDFYGGYYDGSKLDLIFDNNLISALKYSNHLADEDYGHNENNYDFRTNEERDYDSIDDEDAKRDGFPDLWMNEQIDKSDRNEYLKEKQEEMDEIEKNIDEMYDKCNGIKLLDFVEYNRTDYKPSVILLLPSVLSENSLSQIVNIKLDQKSFNGEDYYSGTYRNISVYVMRKGSNLSHIENNIINLDTFRNEMRVELQYSFDYDYKKIYVDINEMTLPPEEFLDDSNEEFEPL